MLGIYGKHPAFGDFLSQGLSDHAQERLVDWLTGAMAAVRDHLGDRWTHVYDHAPMVRFWIGAGVFEIADMRGVLCPSRDKVGRRYPLTLIEEGVGQGAPVFDPAQGFYETAEVRMAEVLASEPADMSEIADRFAALASQDATPSASPIIWAANPEREVGKLMAAVGPADHQSAATQRSYWWTAGAGPRASAFLSCQGVPGPDALAWLLSGVAVEALQANEQQQNTTVTEQRGAYADRE